MRLSVPDMRRRDSWLWLIVVGLVALSGSAMVVSVGVLLLVLAALVMPMFAVTIYAALRSTIAGMAASREHSVVASAVRPRGSLESSGDDVHGWENEGGARRPA
jgi:hypothetical protein